MKYADYYDCDICNGNSVGMSLFVSGCPFHCEDCFNPETWDYDYGKEWTQEVERKFMDLVGRDYIKRVSFLGGSPLCDNNVRTVYQIIKNIHEKYPDKQLWVYTGYTWDFINKKSPDKVEDMFRCEILNLIDVLVDNPFDRDKKDITLAFRGSANQRIIDVQKSIKAGEIILWKNSDKQ